MDGTCNIAVSGENNVFQCQPYVPLGDPNACGYAEEGTGYGCFMAQMVAAWRQHWSTSPMSGTSPSFPFGIVSLAGGTSEGHSNAMPAFRNAQTAGGGLLPNKMIPNSFVAQAFDAGEPAGEVPGGACEMNDQTDEGGYPCKPGFARFTPFFMGKNLIATKMSVPHECVYRCLYLCPTFVFWAR